MIRLSPRIKLYLAIIGSEAVLWFSFVGIPVPLVFAASTAKEKITSFAISTSRAQQTVSPFNLSEHKHSSLTENTM